jgi:tRNA A37 threonylcarbamoyladenosine modification protein TsaB
VNALAFSLKVDIYPFNWFEIIAGQTKHTTHLPVVCAVPASNDNAYAGLIRGASVEIMRFGPLQKAIAEVSSGVSEAAVAGRIRHRFASLLNDVKLIDRGRTRRCFCGWVSKRTNPVGIRQRKWRH